MDARKLQEAIDAISDGFALFDPGERLVTVNGRFRELFGRSAHRLVPGTRYEDLLRQSVAAGEHGAIDDVEAYVAHRLELFRHPREPFEFQIGPGRWALVADHRTADGSTVCVRTDISELKRREHALRDSEANWRQLVDLSPVGIALHDAAGRGRFINLAGRRILALEGDREATSTNVFEFASAESRDRAAETISRILAGESLPAFRFPALRANGERFTAEVTATRLVREGHPHVLVMFRDVSAEAAANQRLRESEARARGILETAPDAIVSIDEDGRIVEFNPAAEQVFGWTRQEVMGRPMSDVIVPGRHREAHDAGMRRFQRTGVAHVLGRRIRIEAARRDGREIPVELAITEVPLQTGRRFTAYIRDISEQLRAEREIFDKSRILEAMMGNVGLGIEVFDADGRLVVANAKALDLFEFPPELRQPGTYDHDMVAWLSAKGEFEGETIAQSVADYHRIRERGEYFNERRRPNGDWLQVRHFQMTGGGHIVLFTDVTEQKLLQSQVLQAQKMDALGQLAGGLAHEFNNILTVIGGYAAMAKGRLPPDHEAIAHLDKVAAGVHRATVLTRELLTFSRSKLVQNRVVDLAAVIRAQEFLLRPLLGELIEATWDLPDRPVWVSIDPDLAAQVLVNLAINARDAMPKGGPLTIALSLPPHDGKPPVAMDPDRLAVLRVSDRGVGMPDHVKARIFEPFFTTKAPGQGTGLGLSLTYGVVKQAGGAIDVETAPRRGTTFRIWLPLSEAPAETSETRRPADPRPRGFRPASILVAEDEPDVRDLVRATLEEAGHTVITAADGIEALERFDEGGIDLLLTDLVMPELGGAKLARLVTDMDPNVRVLYMTGYPSRGQYSEADLPADAVILPKPLDLPALRATVAEALAAQATATPPPVRS